MASLTFPLRKCPVSSAPWHDRSDPIGSAPWHNRSEHRGSAHLSYRLSLKGQTGSMWLDFSVGVKRGEKNWPGQEWRETGGEERRKGGGIKRVSAGLGREYYILQCHHGFIVPGKYNVTCVLWHIFVMEKRRNVIKCREVYNVKQRKWNKNTGVFVDW